MAEDGVQTNIPYDFSTGGLTFQDRGYKQQTFLGASIRNFTMSAGFGDESSTLSIDLVEDEYNTSDGTGQGSGVDVYHNGKYDEFVPPFVGSPVFFTFGKDYATVEQAYLGVYDYIYGSGTTASGVGVSDGNYQGAISGVVRDDLAENEYYDIEKSGTVIVEQDENIGRGHLTFGGILQSFVETRSPQGNSVYSVKVSDPREILNSVNLILNNFTGSINKTDNLYNLYGFLEHNPSDATVEELGGEDAQDVLTRTVDANGKVSYGGTDSYLSSGGAVSYSGFPITGTGFSRRSDRGIPFYRVVQSVNALMGVNAEYLPQEYKDMSFGDKINFRGLKYLVDLSGLPAVPDFYSLDFDSMTLLDLCLEMCDITNTDLYVTLLPVIDYGKWSAVYQKNKTATEEDLITGIIHVGVIERKEQRSIGAIQEYLKDLKNQEIYVKNSDVGFELSNITTDKFVVGAQETTMHFFTTNCDKDNINMAQKRQSGNTESATSLGDQWRLSNAITQQVIPFYGTLGNNHVAPPRGWGAYQQILLDSTGVDADGVGNYYVATELELRCALAGYDKWVEFLMQYNNVYLEPMDSDQLSGGGKSPTGDNLGPDDNPIPQEQNKVYGVTVPRSVYKHYGNSDEEGTKTCNPPFGWPLYYHRALNLGIPQAGLVNIQYYWNTQIAPDLQKLKASLTGGEEPNQEKYIAIVNQTWDSIKNKIYAGEGRELLGELAESILQKIKDGAEVLLIEERIENSIKTSASFSKFFKKGTKNAKAVHEFLKNIASECLGKKYLVKIPRNVNFCFDKEISYGDTNQIYKKGPFGFRPYPKTSKAINKHDKDFKASYKSQCDSSIYPILGYLSSGVSSDQTNFLGALGSNYNPFSDKYEFNYYPDTEGGFFAEDIYKELLSSDQSISIRTGASNALGFSGLKNQLVPLDLPKFINTNNRISAYVRFDHSENLFFGSIDKNDFTQEKIVTGGRVPDIAYELDNIDSEAGNFHTFYDAKKQDESQKSVAFLKCSIDSEFYYLPDLVLYEGKVYNEVSSGTPEISQPKEIYDKDNDSYNVVSTYARTHFAPSLANPTQVSKGQDIYEFATKTQTIAGSERTYINTDSYDRDLDSVYVLITLPSKIEPTKDSRFRDGPYQSLKPESVKHFLTMDVVKNFSPFEELSYAIKPASLDQPISCDEEKKSNSEITKDSIKVLEKLQYAFPQQIDFMVPSPVVPDLVALPLRSTERCYGPWGSQWIDTRTEDEQKRGDPLPERFIELGGPVEFIKDENFSPWNYAGYKGLNEAGKLQAEFANNLLLLSERGGFSYADAPKNVYLAEELKSKGPLVTNINVSISDAGINTTVQLDLYTVSFGKLHKYRQHKLQQTAREKLKLRDEKNALIRKGMAKNQKNQDYQTLYNKIEEDVKNAEQANRYLLSKNNGSHPTSIVASVVKNKTKGHNYDTKAEVDVLRQGIEMSAQSLNDTGLISENFNSIETASVSFSNSAGGSWKDMYAPISNDPNYINMSYKKDSFHETRKDFYPEVNIANTTEDDLTTYEE